MVKWLLNIQERSWYIGLGAFIGTFIVGDDFDLETVWLNPVLANLLLKIGYSLLWAVITVWIYKLVVYLVDKMLRRMDDV